MLEKELIEHSKEPGALLNTLIKIEKTDISQEDIMNCQLAGLLMESIRPLYDTTTQQGRFTRRLLTKYSDLMRTAVDDWEPPDHPPSLSPDQEDLQGHLQTFFIQLGVIYKASTGTSLSILFMI